MKPPARTPRKTDRPRRPPPGPRRLDTHWASVADWYDALVGDSGSDYQQNVVFPGAMRLLQIGPADRVLDVACGQGAFSRVLRTKGAAVTGVDAASSMIQLAMERSDPSIQFHVADARDLAAAPDLAGKRFTAAALLLAIQDLDPIEPVFKGIAALLEPMARCVVVMMHPCFRVPKNADWGYDEEHRTQYRRIDRYLLAFKEKIITHPGQGDGLHTWTFHRPLQSYVRALSGAGLLVDAMEEWPSHRVSDSGPRAAAENTARREIPMFLALRAIKR